MTDTDPYEAICRAADSGSIAPPNFPLKVDEGIVRYHDCKNDKKGTRNAYYLAISNPDGTIGGILGSFKLQFSCNWCTSVTRTFTPAEKAEFARQQAAARAKAEADKAKRHADAARKATELWQASRPASIDHQYLLCKGVAPHRARQHGPALVLDYRNQDGIITTLQFIDTAGNKRFLSGGEVSGSSHRFGGKLVDCIILGEGWATCATLYEAGGYPVAVCGSAGNLLSVAVGIRAKHPEILIIVAGDADPVGRRYAMEAAEAVDGVICLPDFTIEEG